MDFKYCPKCGEKLILKEIGDEGEIPYCTGCSRPWFSFSYPCVICLVIGDNGKIALIRQYNIPRSICVAGFLKSGETAEACAAREVTEETGLEVVSAEYVASYYYPKNDNLMLGFAVKVKAAPFRLSKEVESADWFSLADAAAELSKGATGKLLLKDYFSKCIASAMGDYDDE